MGTCLHFSCTLIKNINNNGHIACYPKVNSVYCAVYMCKRICANVSPQNSWLKLPVSSNAQPERHRHGGGAGAGNSGSGTFKIFVGNLSHCATSGDIRNLFEQYGTIAEADVITARGIKTYGFVHMVSRADGEAAIAALNGYVLHGRVCVCVCVVE